MRPERPAWTGSPDRRPSDIPAVEIPEEVRARAAANERRRRVQRQHAEGESEGGIIVTPPGPGGDVHGDPGVEVAGGGTPPAPPSSGSAGPT